MTTSVVGETEEREAEREVSWRLQRGVGIG